MCVEGLLVEVFIQTVVKRGEVDLKLTSFAATWPVRLPVIRAQHQTSLSINVSYYHKRLLL